MFVILAVFHWGFCPVQAGYPDDFMLMYLMLQVMLSGAYFGIMLLLEIKNFLQALTAKQRFVFKCRRQRGQMDFCDRLLTLYRLWWKNAGSDSSETKLRDMENMLSAIKQQCDEQA